MGRTSRRTGIASIRPSCCSIRTRKAITGLVNWSGEMFGYVQDGSEDADLKRDDRDNAWCMPKSVVVDDAFDWGDDRLLDTPQAESVIYEVHVKGFSKLCPHIPEEIRGTYAGSAATSPSTISRSSASPRSSCCRCIIS